MGLLLKAEQKSIKKIFKIEEQYVIPAYQRPYSWGYDQCFQLYNDIMKTYRSDKDYFLGNIIIAKSEAKPDILEVIDGQQRLITLLLFVKVLFIFKPELKVLRHLLELEDDEGNNAIPRIKTKVFEAKDSVDFNSVLKYDKKTFDERIKVCKDKKGEKFRNNKFKSEFEQNILFFYDWISFYEKREGHDLKSFITTYFLRRVFLLPIELSGNTQEEAKEKALTIFETMNNRGLNLEDADIFKANLYRKAKNINEETAFISEWVEFKTNCEELKLAIDDVFRFYSHIIRGKEGKTSSEKKLREFFMSESFSPFELKTYKEILKDLFKIIEVLQFINKEKNKETELAKWLQLIDAYTNQYPKFALITYLFIHDMEIDKQLIIFLKSLVRYVYSEGSTTTVKFEIYSIIRQVCNHYEVKNYYKDTSISNFKYGGRLKYSYALLAYYLKKDTAISNYSIDRLINLNDKDNLGKNWITTDLDNLESLVNTLGNFVVLDIPKRSLSHSKKIDYYKKSKLDEVKNLISAEITEQHLIKRDEKLKEILVEFFKGN